jgi:soluble lytic murein transglycosylase-like protein
MKVWGRRVEILMLILLLGGASILVALYDVQLAQVAHADIYVRRNTKGTLSFTNVPDSPDYQVHVRTLRTRPARGRLRPRKNTTEFDALIRKAGRRHGVEFALIKAVIKAESGFDIRALSPAGARGLMQLMPATAAMHGVANIYSPKQNIEGGVRHLRLLLKRYRGNLKLTLAAYNAGEKAVQKYRGIPPYRETRQYVRRVLRYRQTYKKRAQLDQTHAG